MPAKKTSKRKCSQCFTAGHTRRTCPSATVSHGGHVFVRTQKGSTSPFVINLKQPERHISVLPTYTEKKHARIVRHTVDFAKLVQKKYQKMAFVVDAHMPHSKRARVKATRPSAPAAPKRQVKKMRPEPITVSPNVPPQPRHHAGNVRTWQRVAVAAVALFIIVALPFPALSYYRALKQTGASLVNAGTYGFSSLEASTLAALQSNPIAAQEYLAEALGAFSEAQSILDEQHHVAQVVARFIPFLGSAIEERQALLQAGHHIALGNTYLIKGVRDAQAGQLHMTDRLAILQDHLRASRPQYEQALQELARIPTAIVPTEQQEVFEEFQVLFASFVNDIDDMADLIDALSLVLGEEDFRRYLIVFQNEHELRATGGFIGSFAVCDFQKGALIGCDVPSGGSYDLKGQLGTYVKPPVPLQLVNGRWEFQDANWWPDFPASAAKLTALYEDSRDTTVDGVIAVNSGMLERFLSVVGPIKNDQYDVVLDAETAAETLQIQVEQKYDKEANTPKAIIGDLSEQFISLVQELDTVDMVQLLTAMYTGANEKDIQVYFTDAEQEEVFRSFGWTGDIVPTQLGQDYLLVVNTNIQGQKSDAKIVQDIEHQAEILPDGRVQVTVAVHRKHTGRVGEQFYGGPNISYTRFYVPQGAILQEAVGFEFPPEESFHVPESWYDDDSDLEKIETKEQVHLASGTRVTEQFGKTVFGNWIITEPGEESDAYIVYELPFRVYAQTPVMPSSSYARLAARLVPTQARPASRYTLITQKQAGNDSSFASTIVYPDGWSPAWKSEDTVLLAANGATIEAERMPDAVYGIVMQYQQSQ